ncbi:MAG: thiol peroxidase [Simkaniaceae bacterium]|nr:thiol peroxidase [Candidatus Sacchlamyda saccharinae]
MAKITLKNNPIQTNGELPKIGASAPDFTLVDRDLANHSLKDYSGKRKVLSIVPSLDTAVCSSMAKKFNDVIKEKTDVILLVISADLPFAQKRFCVQENVDNAVTLSMMRNKDFARDYGVLIEDGPLAGICARAVIVLDENDQVIYSELVPEITQEPDYEKALTYLV